MNVVAQAPELVDGVEFLDRTRYVVDDTTEERDGDYGLQQYFLHRLEDDTIVYLPTSIFLVIPDTHKLDPRSMQEKAWDDNKQRDTDYIRVYKERMGIIVPKSYEEEEYYRHRENGSSPDVGLPEDHTLSHD